MNRNGGKKALNEEMLEQVVGGVSTGVDQKRKQEFEAAWSLLKNARDFTSHQKVALYEEWEASGFTPSATEFLSRLG